MRIVVIVLALAFIVGGMALARRAGGRSLRRRPKPGTLLFYKAEGKTSARCRELLGAHEPDDLLGYELEGAKSGNWYITFTAHRPTDQMLESLYLLQFEGEDPARFSLRFIREAFGTKEPILPLEDLDSFFYQKLGARRLDELPPPDGKKQS